ncbi:MAG TPA: uroporphyrinogen decarboxylase family protein [Clostridia bacterium]|nr:uroporphyrinogen decarboxylase family protein [Clostridia bacterium]
MATSRERIGDLLAARRNDFVGLYENIWPDTLEKWLAQGYPRDPDGAPQDPVDVFGYDLGRLGAAFDTMPRRGYRRVLEHNSEWEIVEDGAGAVTKRFLNRSATPGHMSWSMTGPAEWEARFKPPLLETDDERVPARRLEASLAKRRAQGLWTCFNSSFIWENFRQAVGDVRMYESLLDDEEWVLDYNRTQLDFYIRHFDRAMQLAGAPDGAWFSEDLAYNQGLFCSPKVLERLFFPFYAELVAYFHRRGMKVVLHSCGNVERALPLIVEAGFDALHPMQIRAGCDPLGFARRYGGKLAFLGGLDGHLLEQGDADRIREAQIRLMDGMREAGARYIFCSDHSISSNVSLDTYRRVLDTYHQRSGRA